MIKFEAFSLTTPYLADFGKPVPVIFIMKIKGND